jgi:hypothetical protein
MTASDCRLTIEDFAQLRGLLYACICIRSATQQLCSLLQLLELRVLAVVVASIVAIAAGRCLLAVLLLQLSLLLAGHLHCNTVQCYAMQ